MIKYIFITALFLLFNTACQKDKNGEFGQYIERIEVEYLDGEIEKFQLNYDSKNRLVWVASTRNTSKRMSVIYSEDSILISSLSHSEQSDNLHCILGENNKVKSEYSKRIEVLNSDEFIFEITREYFYNSEQKLERSNMQSTNVGKESTSSDDTYTWDEDNLVQIINRTHTPSQVDANIFTTNFTYSEIENNYNLDINAIITVGDQERFDFANLIKKKGSQSSNIISLLSIEEKSHSGFWNRLNKRYEAEYDSESMVWKISKYTSFTYDGQSPDSVQPERLETVYYIYIANRN